ncbi:MAG: phenylalanine--tRNA ligase subunit alpha [Pseudomonadota bacterium]
MNETLVSAISEIEGAASSSSIEELRTHYLGKKGVFTEQLKTLATLPPEERKIRGQELNLAKQKIAEAIEAKSQILKIKEINERVENEWIDVTLPAREAKKGYIHPISKVLEEINTIFDKQGFLIAEGPEIEDDYHNFTALNFPENHPARQMHDTFFLKTETELATNHQPLTANLLRTHTSPVQIRTMKAGKPPFRFIAPGRTFRSDSDLTHTPMFHQVEGFVVDKNINMGHLKGIIEAFLKEFFELPNLPLRFRPSFFPFTEPSAEVDIGCSRNKDEIKIGAGSDWLEVMGCGMIHPNVLKNCNIDPEEWQGFAFGVGVERLAMLKYGIADLRTFFESDIRWLKHYGFPASQEI